MDRPTSAPPGPTQGRRRWAWGLLLAVAIAGVYGRCVNYPMVFDDVDIAQNNPTAHQFFPLRGLIFPPPGLTTTCRPLLNISAAVNWAISENDPWSYRVGNIAIHLATALLWWSLLRRVLGLEVMPTVVRQAREGLSLAATWLWVLHPLTIIPVVTIAQRAESLGCLMYVATLYAALRGATAQSTRGRRGWWWGAVALCWLAVSSKELGATIPLLALLADRLLISESWKQALQRHGKWYLMMAASWVWLAYLIKTGGNRNGTAGFTSWHDSWNYVQLQPQALLLYLRLVVLPYPLVFDYGVVKPGPWWQTAIYGATLAPFLLLTLWGVTYHRPWALVGGWFFIILGPTSSFVPIVTQTMSEHRMYLPSAGLLAGLVVGGYLGLRRLADTRRQRRLATGLTTVAVLALALVTWRRVGVFASPFRLWSDNVAKAPGNVRGYCNLGDNYAAIKNDAYALACYQTAWDIDPQRAETLVKWSALLQQMGRFDQAEERLHQAGEIAPDDAHVHDAAGNYYASRGRFNEALRHYQRALEINPTLPSALSGAGMCLAMLDRDAEAETAFRKALAMEPSYSMGWGNLGALYSKQQRYAQALEAFQHMPEYAGDYPSAYTGWVDTLVRLNRQSEARAVAQRALRKVIPHSEPAEIQALNHLKEIAAPFGSVPAAPTNH